MRSMAVGVYTAAQVERQLRSRHYAFDWRFELLDPTLAVVGEIEVLGATIEQNVDRAIKGALRLTMLPDERLRQPFAYRIKPWFRVKMPDGGWAEFPLGVFVWNVAERTLPVEQWDVTLGDQGHLLEGGPGPAGFSATAQTPVTFVMADALTRAGFIDTSGIEHNASSLMGADKSWGAIIGTPLPPPQPDPVAPVVEPPPEVLVPVVGGDIGRDATAEELARRADEEARRLFLIAEAAAEVARQRSDRPTSQYELEEIERQRREREEWLSNQ